MPVIIGTPHAKGAGYYSSTSDGKTTEADIRTCTHCQRVVNMQKWARGGGWCPQCSAPVCIACAKKMQTAGCEPFMKQLEKIIETQHRSESFRKLAGLDTPEPTREIFVPPGVKGK